MVDIQSYHTQVASDGGAASVTAGSGRGVFQRNRPPSKKSYVGRSSSQGPMQHTATYTSTVMPSASYAQPQNTATTQQQLHISQLNPNILSNQQTVTASADATSPTISQGNVC